MTRTLVVLVLLLLLAPVTALTQGGNGGGRQRAGGHDSKCGLNLVVVRADGEKEQFESIEKFLGSFATTQIEQGEQARTAVRLDQVLKAYTADWAEALDCENHSLQLPSGLPMEGRDFLVLTGKGTLKTVSEARPGEYRNTAQQIRKLTFHRASGVKRAPVPATGKP